MVRHMVYGGDYIYIIEGDGSINKVSIKSGDFIMVSSLDTYQFDAHFKIAKINIK